MEDWRLASKFLHPIAWPVVGLSVLLTLACLAATVSIARVQADLRETLRADAVRLQAAQQAQIHLREYRVHTIVLAAGPTDARRQQVDADRNRIQSSLDALDRLAVEPDDLADFAELRDGWVRYEDTLAKDLRRHPQFGRADDLAAWAENHRVMSLLVPCGRLVERSQARMEAATARSDRQSSWAGWTLVAVGVVGPLAGLVGGYTVARSLSRRVARLSVRVRAARSHLDQDVGSVTVERTDSLADIDRQLGVVVDRIGVVCRRVQDQDRELLRAEQLAAVGNLAAGVAHEIRNPLTGIKMLVEAAVRPASPAPLTDADLHLIRDEIARLERTVQGLLDYAKPAPTVRTPQDVRPVVERSVEIVAPRAARAGVAVEFLPAAAPVVAPLDPDQFTSLLTNLLLNAVEATPAGGRVWVEAKAAGAGIAVTVSDTGPGIAAGVSADMFTPFATTKAAGTGLGLVVARRVAADHGGELTARNRPDGGASFTVTLPAAEPDRAEAAHR